MRHLYEVRAGLELQALQRPARIGTRHDPAILEPLRDQWRALAHGRPAPAGPELRAARRVVPRRAGHGRRQRGAPSTSSARSTSGSASCGCTTSSSSSASSTTIAEHLAPRRAGAGGDIVNAEAAFAQHLGDSMAVVEERVRGAIVRMLHRRDDHMDDRRRRSTPRTAARGGGDHQAVRVAGGQRRRRPDHPARRGPRRARRERRRQVDADEGDLRPVPARGGRRSRIDGDARRDHLAGRRPRATASAWCSRTCGWCRR